MERKKNVVLIVMDQEKRWTNLPVEFPFSKELPYRNKLLGKHKKNKWTIDCGLSHSRIEWSSYSNDAKR